MEYCDRQGCLRRGEDIRILSDGCRVTVCKDDLRYFKEEGEKPSVYFHEHTVVS